MIRQWHLQGLDVGATFIEWTSPVITSVRKGTAISGVQQGAPPPLMAIGGFPTPAE